jgi:hypothetical protein
LVASGASAVEGRTEREVADAMTADVTLSGAELIIILLVIVLVLLIIYLIRRV